MKKLKTFIALGLVMLATFAFTGCTTTGGNQAQIATAALVLQQGSYQGAKYAIQQNASNAKYFVLADTAIKTFATGQNLSPTAFEAQLALVDPSLQNQWVQLAVDTTIVTYDQLYSQYVISNVNSNATAVLFLNSVSTGFEMALSPSNALAKVSKPVARPSVVNK